MTDTENKTKAYIVEFVFDSISGDSHQNAVAVCLDETIAKQVVKKYTKELEKQNQNDPNVKAGEWVGEYIYREIHLEEHEEHMCIRCNKIASEASKDEDGDGFLWYFDGDTQICAECLPNEYAELKMQKDAERQELENKILTDYWMKNYGHTGKCLICGNAGVVRGAVSRKEYCFCPNGRKLRESVSSASQNNNENYFQNS